MLGAKIAAGYDRIVCRCEFRENPNVEDDPCAELKAMTRILIRNRKELVHIVRAIKDKYDEDIRPHITYRNHTTGATCKSPVWSDTSIQKHLVFSSEFPECTDLLIHHIHVSMLMNLNDKMLAENGEVNDEMRKSFTETVKSLTAWRKSTASGWQPTKSI